MNTTMLAICFGLLAAASWGISDFLIGKASRLLGAIKGAILVNTTGAFVYSLAFLIFLMRDAAFTPHGTLYIILGGICFGIAQASFFKAMGIGPVGLVSAVSSLYPLITLLIGLIFLSAVLSMTQVVGVVLVVLGIVLASGVTLKSRKLSRGPALAFIPLVGWGLGWGFVSEAIESMGWQSALLIELWVTALTLLLLVPLIKSKESITLKALGTGWSRRVVWITASIQTLGMLAVYLGIHALPSGEAIVVAVSACYPVLTIFLALRHFDERLPGLQLAGGIVGVIGVIALSLGGPSG